MGEAGSYICYEHHHRAMWVRQDLRGRHREHCLCYRCESFTPENREQNCPIANEVYRLCCEAGLVLAVWECEHFRLAAAGPC